MSTYKYASHLHRLYDGVSRHTDAAVIVDSSKFPTDAIVAAGLPNTEVFVVHMVRDPRAVAFSWSRPKRSPGKASNKGLMRRVGLVRSTLVWVWYNFVIARYVRRAVGDDHYRLLKYEEFAADPQRIISSLVGFVNEAYVQGPSFEGGVVHLRASHTVSGNPVRFNSGEVSISADNEWKEGMPTWRRTLVTLLALPGLLSAKYRVW